MDEEGGRELKRLVVNPADRDEEVTFKIPLGKWLTVTLEDKEGDTNSVFYMEIYGGKKEEAEN